jgi:hypothetical protein
MEAAAPHRDRLLRSKKAELKYVNYPMASCESASSGASDDTYIIILINCSGIVTSRKRKLRELFAVSDNELQLPTLSFKNPDLPPTSTAEAHFLEVTNILQCV